MDVSGTPVRIFTAVAMLLVAAACVLVELDARRPAPAAVVRPAATTSEQSRRMHEASPASEAHVQLVSGAGLDGTAAGDARMPSSTSRPAAPSIIVKVTHERDVRSGPGSGPVIGSLPARSRYLGAEMWAWVQEVSGDRRYGRVRVPWIDSDRSGWISLEGLPRSSTRIMVRADLSTRTLRVYRSDRVVLTAPMAVGAAGSPSPTGRFWVTDPVPVPSGQPQFGSYAFGISALQPHPPVGWTGPRQMAIHGTNDPSSIGTAASAGCLRVSEQVLRRLRGLLRPGTPVEIHA